MIVPRWASVRALYSLQKSMIATPCGPRAVPTGGAGEAWPAGIWILTTARTFFFAILDSLWVGVVAAIGGPGPSRGLRRNGQVSRCGRSPGKPAPNPHNQPR